MSCPLHGLSGTRLVKQVTGSCGIALCFECIFDDLHRSDIVEDNMVQSLEDLIHAALSEEARLQRVPGRLLLRTPLLRLGTKLLAKLSPQASALLVDLLSGCVIEELEARGRWSSMMSTHGVQPDIFEALVTAVAGCATIGDGFAGLPLLVRVLERMEAQAGEVLLAVVESSRTLLTGVAAAIANGCGSRCKANNGTAAIEAAVMLLLRLCEKGSDALRPHLTAVSGHLSKLFAEVLPGGTLATSLLALYSICAFSNRNLLACLLGDSRDDAGYLHRIAVGVHAQLATGSGTLQAAAASLADELATMLGPKLGGALLGRARLAEWLIEVCQMGDGVAAKMAAARALGHLAHNDAALLSLRSYAADALLGACADACGASTSGALGNLPSRLELLNAATGSLRMLLCLSAKSFDNELVPPSPLLPLVPEKILGLLRAACRTDDGFLGRGCGETVLTMADCLVPIQLSVASRTLQPASDARIYEELLRSLAAVASCRGSGRPELVLGTVCSVLKGVAPFCAPLAWPRASKDEVPDLALALKTCVRTLAERAAEGSPFIVSLTVPALVAALEPGLRLDDPRPPPSLWSAAVKDVGVILGPLLAAHGLGSDVLVEPRRLSHLRAPDADKLLAILLASFFRAPGNLICGGTCAVGSTMLVLPDRLVEICASLLRSDVTLSLETLLVEAAILHALHMEGADVNLLDRLLPVVISAVTAEKLRAAAGPLALFVFPARAFVSIAAAAARVGYTDISSHDILCGSLASSLEQATASAEWNMLRADGVIGGARALYEAFTWLFSLGDSCSCQRLLRAAMRHCAAEIVAVDDTPRQGDKAACAAWFVKTAPSVDLFVAAATGLLASVREHEEVAGLFQLLLFVARQDGDCCARTFRREGTIGVAARHFAGGSAVAGEFVLACLASMSFEAFGQEDTDAILEVVARHNSLGDEVALILLDIVVLGLWRSDISRLAQNILALEWLHTSMRQWLSLGSIAAPAELAQAQSRYTIFAWAAVALALLRGVSGSVGESECGRSERTEWLLRMRSFIKVIGLDDQLLWAAGLRQANVLARGYAQLALATVCLFWHDFAALHLQPAIQYLIELVRECAFSLDAVGRDELILARDGACLALVGVFSCPVFLPQDRTTLLHFSDLCSDFLTALLRQVEPQVEWHLDYKGLWGTSSMSTGEVETSLASSPAVLFLLLLLRARPPWLNARQLGSCATQLLSIVQAPQGVGTRRLLALRAAEALLDITSCCDGTDTSQVVGGSAEVLRRLCRDHTIWVTSKEDAYRDSGDQKVLLDGHVQLKWLHHQMSERLCMKLIHMD